MCLCCKGIHGEVREKRWGTVTLKSVVPQQLSFSHNLAVSPGDTQRDESFGHLIVSRAVSHHLAIAFGPHEDEDGLISGHPCPIENCW